MAYNFFFRKMASFIFMILASVTILCTASGQTAFSWASAQKLSKNSGKPILIDFMLEGCAPCKQLHEEILDNPTIRKELDSYFHVFSYDIRKHNIALEETFSVKSYPTTAIVSDSGQLLGKFTGYHSRSSYLESLYDALLPESQSEPVEFHYEIPGHLTAYKEDIVAHRELVRILYDDPAYCFGEDRDPLGIFDDYFYAETDLDTFYVKIVSEKLSYNDTPRKWFLKNVQLLKEEYGLEFMKTPYYNILSADLTGPKYSNGYASLKKRPKQIAKKMTKFLGEDKEHEDSIYHREIFITYNNVVSNEYEFLKLRNNFTLKLLKYQISDDLIEELYNQVLSLSINLRCNRDLLLILQAIDKNTYYNTLPPFIEIQAILYYRLKQEQQAVAKLAEANTIAGKKNLLFTPVFSRLKSSNALIETEHKCQSAF